MEDGKPIICAIMLILATDAIMLALMYYFVFT
jgi:hypothetical protein